MPPKDKPNREEAQLRKLSNHIESKKWSITLITLILSFLSVGLGLFAIYMVPGGATSIADIISTFCMFLGITASTYITGESVIDAGRIWPGRGGGRSNRFNGPNLPPPDNCDPPPPPPGADPHS